MWNTWLNFCYWGMDHGFWIMICIVALGFVGVAYAYISSFLDYWHGRIDGEEFNALWNRDQPVLHQEWAMGNQGWGYYDNGQLINEIKD